jgi:hypothetical protein
MLTITFQRERNIKTTAIRPGSDVAQWKTTVAILHDKEKSFVYATPVDTREELIV